MRSTLVAAIFLCALAAVSANWNAQPPWQYASGAQRVTYTSPFSARYLPTTSTVNDYIQAQRHAGMPSTYPFASSPFSTYYNDAPASSGSSSSYSWPTNNNNYVLSDAGAFNIHLANRTQMSALLPVKLFFNDNTVGTADAAVIESRSYVPNTPAAVQYADTVYGGSSSSNGQVVDSAFKRYLNERSTVSGSSQPFAMQYYSNNGPAITSTNTAFGRYLNDRSQIIGSSRTSVPTSSQSSYVTYSDSTPNDSSSSSPSSSYYTVNGGMGVDSAFKRYLNDRIRVSSSSSNTDGTTTTGNTVQYMDAPSQSVSSSPYMTQQQQQPVVGSDGSTFSNTKNLFALFSTYVPTTVGGSNGISSNNGVVSSVPINYWNTGSSAPANSASYQLQRQPSYVTTYVNNQPTTSVVDPNQVAFVNRILAASNALPVGANTIFGGGRQVLPADWTAAVTSSSNTLPLSARLADSSSGGAYTIGSGDTYSSSFVNPNDQFRSKYYVVKN